MISMCGGQLRELLRNKKIHGLFFVRGFRDSFYKHVLLVKTKFYRHGTIEILATRQIQIMDQIIELC